MGITGAAWAALTFPAKFTAILTKLCACCSTCAATSTDVVVAQVGADVTITWKGTAHTYEVYLNGKLATTILTSSWPSDVYSYTFINAANAVEHDWLIVSKCSDGSIGEQEGGVFTYLGCPTVAPTLLTATVVNGLVANATCPYNLTSLVSLSNPLPAEWHTANNTLASTLVSNPASVAGGMYFVFNKDAGGCYSAGQSVTIACSATSSCTAPQNLLVYKLGPTNFLITFDSAAYPPPLNSYTVKRRLASAADVAGSYTTIGSPVWNAGLNKWTISDGTGVANTLYVYRAISNCGATEPSIDYVYAYIPCPPVVLYPTSTTISYSFAPITEAGIIKVMLYDSSGTILLDTDTYTPAYPNPITGLFEYLTPSTTYTVKVSFKITGGLYESSKTCSGGTVTTDGAAPP